MQVNNVLVELYRILEAPGTLAGYSDGLNIHSPSIVKKQLRKDIAEVGWGQIRKKFVSAVRDVFGTQWLKENLFLAEIFELADYLGYESPILDIVKQMKSSSNFDDAREQITNRVISKLAIQIQRGGNTTFLSVDSLKGTKGIRLVPVIIEQRKTNFLAAMDNLANKQGDILCLSDVLSTSYGFTIAAAIKNSTTQKYLLSQYRRLYANLKKDNHNRACTLSSNSRPDSPMRKFCSNLVVEHLLKNTGTSIPNTFYYCKSYLKMLYESGFRSIFEVIRSILPDLKISNDEYEFIIGILKGVKTRQASVALKLLRTNQWQSAFVLSNI